MVFQHHADIPTPNHHCGPCWKRLSHSSLQSRVFLSHSSSPHLSASPSYSTHMHACITHFLHLILPQACDTWFITAYYSKFYAYYLSPVHVPKLACGSPESHYCFPAVDRPRLTLYPLRSCGGEQLIPLRPSGSSECKMLTRTEICMKIMLITNGVFIESQQGWGERKRVSTPI